MECFSLVLLQISPLLPKSITQHICINKILMRHNQNILGFNLVYTLSISSSPGVQSTLLWLWLKKETARSNHSDSWCFESICKWLKHQITFDTGKLEEAKKKSNKFRLKENEIPSRKFHALNLVLLFGSADQCTALAQKKHGKEYHDVSKQCRQIYH